VNPPAHVPFILLTVHEKLLLNSTSRILQECGQEVERQPLVLLQVGQAAHQIGGGCVSLLHRGLRRLGEGCESTAGTYHVHKLWTTQ
jgi:hypothetical protein